MLSYHSSVIDFRLACFNDLSLLFLHFLPMPKVLTFDPGFERPACLATLKSSDRTKQSVYG